MGGYYTPLRQCWSLLTSLEQHCASLSMPVVSGTHMTGELVLTNFLVPTTQVFQPRTGLCHGCCGQIPLSRLTAEVDLLIRLGDWPQPNPVVCRQQPALLMVARQLQCLACSANAHFNWVSHGKDQCNKYDPLISGQMPLSELMTIYDFLITDMIGLLASTNPCCCWPQPALALQICSPRTSLCHG